MWCFVGGAQSAIGMLGFCSNIAAIFILRKKQCNNSTNFYSLMLLLSIFDLIYISMSLITFSLNKFWMIYQEQAWGYIVPWSIPILQISLTGSIYCTMAITLERYFVICRPFYRFSRKWKPSSFIVPIIVFSLVYNIPRFCERRTCQETRSIMRLSNETLHLHSTKTCGGFVESPITSSQQCAINASETEYLPGIITNSVFVTFTNLKLDKRYQVYSFCSNLIFNLLIPYVFILVLNTKVVLNLRRSQLCASDDSSDGVNKKKGTYILMGSSQYIEFSLAKRSINTNF